MLLTVSHDFLPKQNSTRAAIVMDHFGIGFENGRHVIAEDLELPIESGDVVFFTGASGSGKSSLMRAAAGKLQANCDDETASLHAGSPAGSTHGMQPVGLEPSTLNPQRSTLLNIDDLDLGDRILIDRLPLPVEESMQLLSACGLGEAHLMLRTPAELSDGQRYRFRLALGLSERPSWIVADEFTATLDRTLARVIAFNIRRLADRTGTGFLLATTHEDVAEDLSPNLQITCRLDSKITTHRNEDPPRSTESSAPLKKNDLLHPKPLDQPRVQVRLAVLRSVALSEPSRWVPAVCDFVMAWGRAGGGLCVCFAADLVGAPESVLWPVGALGADVDAGAQPAACAVVAGRHSSDLSRSGDRGSLRPSLV